MTRKVSPFSPEVRAHAVQMGMDHGEELGSRAGINPDELGVVVRGAIVLVGALQG